MKEATAVYYRNNDKKAQVRVPALIRYVCFFYITVNPVCRSSYCDEDISPLSYSS